MNTGAAGVRVKTALVLIVFCVVGLGPIPVTSTIGLFVVIFRPNWFQVLIKRMYAQKTSHRFRVLKLPGNPGSS